MNTKLVEKNLGKITSKDFPDISVKNEDWKYTGKNVYSVNEFEIGKPVNIEKDETFYIGGASYVLTNIFHNPS